MDLEKIDHWYGVIIVVSALYFVFRRRNVRKTFLHELSKKRNGKVRQAFPFLPFKLHFSKNNLNFIVSERLREKDAYSYISAKHPYGSSFDFVILPQSKLKLNILRIPFGSKEVKSNSPLLDARFWFATNNDIKFQNVLSGKVQDVLLSMKEDFLELSLSKSTLSLTLNCELSEERLDDAVALLENLFSGLV